MTKQSETFKKPNVFVEEGVREGPRFVTDEAEAAGIDEVETEAELEGHAEGLAVALDDDDCEEVGVFVNADLKKNKNERNTLVLNNRII